MIAKTSQILLLLLLQLCIWQQVVAQFNIGVASFDVGSDSAILWTRVDNSATVHAQLANDATFALIVIEKMDIPVNSEMDYTSHVLIEGLLPNQIYFYRFLNQDRSLVSNTGQFKTLQGTDVNMSNKTLIFSGAMDGVWRTDGTSPYFDFLMPMLTSMSAQAADAFFFSGDTIYADSTIRQQLYGMDAVASQQFLNSVHHGNREFETMINLLQKGACYAMWDDRDVKDNWTSAPVDMTQVAMARDVYLSFFPNFVNARNNSFKTLEDPIVVEENNMDYAECVVKPMFRHISINPLIDVFFLDTRSCRSIAFDIRTNELCTAVPSYQYPYPLVPADVAADLYPQLFSFLRLQGIVKTEEDEAAIKNVSPACIEALSSSNRTLLGITQRNQFLSLLRNSTAKYKLVITMQPISQFLYTPYERFEGYPYERQLILDAIRNDTTSTVIFLSSELHAPYMGQVYDDHLVQSTSTALAYEVLYGPIAAFTPLEYVRSLAGDFLFALARPSLVSYVNTLVAKLKPAQCKSFEIPAFAVAKFDALAGQLQFELRNANNELVQEDAAQPLCHLQL